MRTRRRRRSGRSSVSVAWAGGAWQFTPGAGVLDLATETLNVAPTTDTVDMDWTGTVAASLGIAVQVGETTAIDVGSSPTVADEVVSVTALKNLEAGSFSVSGSVRFTPTAGPAVTYNFLPHTI